MKYEYKRLDIDYYINSLYTDGLNKSEVLSDEEIRTTIRDIGIFKFKGYVKAFRNKLSEYAIDDILFLYHFDRKLSSHLLELTSKIEIKLKTYLIEIAYTLTDNPFFYLIADNYKNGFNLPYDTLYDWEVKEQKGKKELYPHYRDYYLGKYDFQSNYKTFLSGVKLINLNKQKNINYPPFHYLIESATLGNVIRLLSEVTIDKNDILKLLGKKFGILNPKVFISYLLRLKELRNRCAHNGRIFNRNYRSVKAIGTYKNIRKDIYDHRLLDVYYTLYFLLGEEEQFKNSFDLEKKLIDSNLNITNKNLKKFILNCLRKNIKV
jgi:abortive infection bacteriophage resistance protein